MSNSIKASEPIKLPDFIIEKRVEEILKEESKPLYDNFEYNVLNYFCSSSNKSSSSSSSSSSSKSSSSSSSNSSSVSSSNLMIIKNKEV